jgi:hypothetical protein
MKVAVAESEEMATMGILHIVHSKSRPLFISFIPSLNHCPHNDKHRSLCVHSVAQPKNHQYA